MAMAGPVNYEFVEEIPEDHTCAICTNVLTDPALTGCCGQGFCQSCLSKWLEKNNTCPHCRSNEIKYIQDHRMRRSINDLKVYCPNKTTGCGVIITIGSYNNHLDKCQFTLVNCKLNCGQVFLRKLIQEHELENCENREVFCKYCQEKGQYKVITTSHLKTCNCFPLPCPNKCGVNDIQRRNIPAHREICPLEQVLCSFDEAGCRVQVARKDLDQHLAENTQQHLMLVSRVAVTATQKLQQTEEKLNKRLEETEEKLSKTENDLKNVTQQFKEVTTRVERELSVMSKVGKQEIDVLRTAITPILKWDTLYCLKLDRTNGAPAFYIHPGYRIGIQYTSFTMWSYQLHLIVGAYDDQLPWPIPNNIEIELMAEGQDNRIAFTLCNKCNNDLKLSRPTLPNYGVKAIVRFKMSPNSTGYIYIKIKKHTCL